MKKIASAFLLALLLVGVHISPAQAVLHTAGSNIVTPDGTVYTITKENDQLVRRPYTSGGAFLSYSYNSWESVTGASAEDLALPLGSFIPPQDGKVVCSDRGSDKGTCYLITSGKKAGFTNAEVFTRMGYNFNYALVGDVSFLPSTANIDNSTSQHKPGALINKDGTIYLVSNTGLLGLPDWSTLQSWGYKTTDIVPANSADRALPVIGTLVSKKPDEISPPIREGQPKLIVSDPFVSFNYTSGGANPPMYIAHISNSSSNKTIRYSISVPNKPAWLNSNFATEALPLDPLGTAGIGIGINAQSLTPGTYTTNIHFSGDFDNSPASIKVNLIVSGSSTTTAPLQITTTNLPDATVGQAYSTQLQVQGGTAPYTWSTISTTYPSGCCVLGLNGNSQPLSSTTVTFNTQSSATVIGPAGTYTWNIEVADAAGQKTNRTITLTIKAAANTNPLTITTSSLPNATIGQAYSTQLQASGGTAPYTWRTLDTTYPYGCCVLGVGDSGAFNTQSGSTVSGPAGNFTWNVELTDSASNKVTKQINLTILPGSTPTFNIATATPLPEAKVGVAYSQKITFYYSTNGINYATNGTATGLPPGIGPSSITGILPGTEGPGKASYTLSGTPTEAGSYSVQLYLTDQYGASTLATFTLVVKP